MLLISKIYAAAQKVPEDFGYRHIKLKYLDDPVDVIVISKVGEERIAKPLFLFCQDSLPKPTITYSEKGLYEVLPFQEEELLVHFHIVIVGKPFIPVISNTEKLTKDFLFLKDQERQIATRAYLDRNYLDYYVFRNNSILKQLFKYRWAKTSKLLVAGQGEGSSIAVKMATINKKITHLIHWGGNPYGKMTAILEEKRLNQNSIIPVIPEDFFTKWRNIVENSTEIEYNGLETSKSIYSFSAPQRDNLIALKIPILFCYDREGCNVILNDLLQLEAIRAKSHNIEFACHNRAKNDDSKSNESENWLKWWQRKSV